MTFGHHQLHSRHRFEGTLRPESPLRLSSGRASETTDAPLMRDRSGRIYLPGTSLRGALRSEIERTLAAVGDAAGLTTCVLFSESHDPDACLSVNPTRQEALLQIDEDDKALQFVRKNLCDVCKLFGSPVYASRLVIEDAYPVEDADLRSKTAIRDGVGIDRDTGTARENVKFNFEVLEPGVDFKLRLAVENLDATDRKLLDVAFGLLRGGLHLGGKRAGGCGLVRLVDELEVRGFEGPEALWAAVMKGGDPHRPLEWEGGAGC